MDIEINNEIEEGSDWITKEDKKEIIALQKLLPKGESLIGEYKNAEVTQIEWIVARKLDGTFQMSHIENGVAVKLGKKSVSNPMELEKYVSWIKTE